jgi:hypothetical protein
MCALRLGTYGKGAETWGGLVELAKVVIGRKAEDATVEEFVSCCFIL